MTTAIDFNKPATTDNYSTGFVPLLQANLQALGMMLDSALCTYTNLPTGTKRINSSTGLLEQYNGSTWAAMAMGYVLKAGDTMTGAMTIALSASSYNLSLSGKTTTTAVSEILAVRTGTENTNVGQGAGLSLQNTTAGTFMTIQHYAGQAQFISNTGSGWVECLRVSQTGLGVLTVPAVALHIKGAEARLQDDAATVSGYDTAGTVGRTGYLRFSTGVATVLAADGALQIRFATNGVTQARIDSLGNLGVGVAPYASWPTAYRGIAAGPSAMYGTFYGSSNGTGFGTSYGQSGLTQNTVYNGTNNLAIGTGGGSMYLQGGGYHLWYTMVSVSAGATQTAVLGMTLDVSNNLTVAGKVSSQGGGQFVNTAGSSYNENLRLPRASSGYASIQLACDTSGSGTISGQFFMAVYPSGTNGGAMYMGCNGTNFLLVSTAGVSAFQGGVFTQRIAMGNQTTLAIDWSKSNYFTLTATANMTYGFSNASDGQTITIKVTQDATGGRTLTNTSAVKWPGGVVGVLSTAANAVDIICYTYDAATGFYYATISKGFA